MWRGNCNRLPIRMETIQLHVAPDTRAASVDNLLSWLQSGCYYRCVQASNSTGNGAPNYRPSTSIITIHYRKTCVCRVSFCLPCATFRTHGNCLPCAYQKTHGKQFGTRQTYHLPCVTYMTLGKDEFAECQIFDTRQI